MRDPLRDPEPLIRRVYAYVAYRIGSGPEAEDVTADVFERALRYRDTFDPRRGDSAAWLIGIARRALADAARRQVETAAYHEETAGEGHEERSLRRLELQRAVSTLDERDRELVALRYGADLTARQIAELLDLRVNAVEVALHRALRRLREELGEPARNPRVAESQS